MKGRIEDRLADQLSRQRDRELGAVIREEARAKLTCGLCGFDQSLPPEKYESWNALLDDEEREPIPNISAGAAAIVMLEVHQSSMNRQAEPGEPIC